MELIQMSNATEYYVGLTVDEMSLLTHIIDYRVDIMKKDIRYHDLSLATHTEIEQSIKRWETIDTKLHNAMMSAILGK